MNKILFSILLGGLAVLAAFPAEKTETCSYYVTFRPEACARAKVCAPKGSRSSRRVETSSLLTSPSRAEAFTCQVRPYAISMRIGNRLPTTYRIDFEGVGGENAGEEIREWLKGLPDVTEVERVPDVYVASDDVQMPFDPLYSCEDIDAGWHLRQIGYDRIYGKYFGSPDVLVAIVDNAVWGEHPDLQIAPENQYFCYTDEVGRSAPPTNIDQNEVVGNIADSQAAAWSHGTHCAGLVGAIADNGEGIASFASGVTLMGVRCADSAPNTMNRGYEGVLWAIDNGADILSLSWGNGTVTDTERELIEGAIEQGVIIVAAAGNDGVSKKIYPACYDGVICVGSVDSDGERSSFSNYGDWVTVSTPGGFLKEDGKVVPLSQMILSTTYSVNVQYAIDGRHSIDGLHYDGKAGTSMATPLTASVVALMKSVYPELNPRSASEILTETSKHGVIDAATAVERAAQMSGISTVTVGKDTRDAIYSLQGVLLRHSADTSGLAKGIYIVCNDGKTRKIIVE